MRRPLPCKFELARFGSGEKGGAVPAAVFYEPIPTAKLPVECNSPHRGNFNFQTFQSADTPISAEQLAVRYITLDFAAAQPHFNQRPM